MWEGRGGKKRRMGIKIRTTAIEPNMATSHESTPFQQACYNEFSKQVDTILKELPKADYEFLQGVTTNSYKDSQRLRRIREKLLEQLRENN